MHWYPIKLLDIHFYNNMHWYNFLTFIIDIWKLLGFCPANRELLILVNFIFTFNKRTTVRNRKIKRYLHLQRISQFEWACQAIGLWRRWAAGWRCPSLCRALIRPVPKGSRPRCGRYHAQRRSQVDRQNWPRNHNDKPIRSIWSFLVSS